MNTETKRTHEFDVQDYVLDACWIVIALLLVGMLIFSIL